MEKLLWLFCDVADDILRSPMPGYGSLLHSIGGESAVILSILGDDDPVDGAI